MNSNSASLPFWWLALLPLLLAAALAIPLLNHDGFNGDEPAYVIMAGALRAGNPSLAEVWDSLTPRVAAGWPTLLALWGPIVGWSEPAIRSLTLFVGLLTIAVVCRAGKDFFSAPAGIVAATLLAASVFHHAFMLQAIPYASVALFAAMTIWGYRHVSLRFDRRARGAQANLLLGSVGLAYSHFLAAFLVPIVFLYHILFAPRRRGGWKRASQLLILAGAAGALQLPLLIRGWDFTRSENLHFTALQMRALLANLLHDLSNGILEVTVTSTLIVYVLAATILLAAGGISTTGGFLSFAGTGFLLAALVFNEWMVIFTGTRMRYLMPLWPVTALLVGAGLCRLFRSRRLLATALLALWVIQGSFLALATDFRYELGFFFRLDLHHLRPTIPEIVPPGDFLVVDSRVAQPQAGHHRYFHLRSMDRAWGIYCSDLEAFCESSGEDLHSYPGVWLFHLTKDREEFIDVPARLDRVSCGVALESRGYTLERLAPSAAECAGDQAATHPGTGNLTSSPPDLLATGRFRA